MKISRNWLNNYIVSNKTDNELVDAFYDKGVTAKKRDEIYKLGESNKSFAHFGKS